MRIPWIMRCVSEMTAASPRRAATASPCGARAQGPGAHRDPGRSRWMPMLSAVALCAMPDAVARGSERWRPRQRRCRGRRGRRRWRRHACGSRVRARGMDVPRSQGSASRPVVAPIVRRHGAVPARLEVPGAPRPRASAQP